MTEVMPRPAVRRAPKWAVESGVDQCGHCKAGHCRSCKGAVRVPVSKKAPHGVIECYCSSCVPQVRCLECGNQFPQDVDPKTWVCLDPLLCWGRVELRKSQSRIWRMIQECKTASAIKRRTDRQRREQIVWEVGPEAEDRIASRTPRPTSGVCECCGAATKGGRYAPGHDAKHKSTLRKAADAGDKDAYRQLVERGWV